MVEGLFIMETSLAFGLKPKNVAAANKLRSSLIAQGFDAVHANGAYYVRSGQALLNNRKSKPGAHGVQGEYPRTLTSR